MRAPGYRVAITADAARPDGQSIFGDLGLERLEAAGMAWEVLPEYWDPIPAEQLNRFDAVLSLGHTRFGADTVAHCPSLRHIARFGAGYESIDLDACTANGIAVTNTPDGVRRPVALAALTLVLALAHQLPAKDLLTRQGRWSDRGDFRGHGVDGKTLGIIGFGSVGSELAELAQHIGLTVVGNNRSGRSAAADELGVPLLGLEELLTQSDYVVVTAAQTAENRGFLDAGRLGLMKRSAYFVNVARGTLVDQAALVAALRERRIAGAGLDVFDPEPVELGDELLRLDNVLLSPHSLPWTEEFTRDVSASALGALIDVAGAREPQHLLNRGVLQSEAWLARSAAR